ncbi:MAG: glycosyltransferase [Vicinamibacterales bacterium]
MSDSRHLPATAGAESPSPALTIVIPHCNRRALTVACLESLLRLDTSVRFEVVLVDNGSTDGTTDAVEAAAHGARVPVRSIVNAANVGFARACNQGAREAAAPLLLFLNNDTEAVDDFLAAPCRLLLGPGKIGIVGVQLRYRNHLVQHAGIVFDRHKRPQHVYRHFRGESPYVGGTRELQAVTGACLFVPRDLFETLGGFDEGYLNGWEDIDLCFRVRALGRRVVYCGSVWLFHLEGQSDNRLMHVNENRARFVERWGSVVQADEPMVHEARRRLQSTRSDTRKWTLPARATIAIHIGVPTRAHLNWGDIFYAESLARSLRSEGHAVVVRYLDEWYSAQPRADVVIHLKGLSRYRPDPGQVNLLWVLNHPELHHAEELNQYDLVFTASDVHRQAIADLVSVPVVTLPQVGDHAHFAAPHDTADEPVLDVLFVGNNYGARRGETRRAVADLLAAGLGDRLHVVGESWEGVVPGECILARFVDWQTLPALYRRAKIVLNDHQLTMRSSGFINNRTFDLAHAGIFQIADDVPGLDAFGVTTYRTVDELRALVLRYLDDADGRRSRADLVRRRCADRTFDRAAGAILDAVRERARLAPPVEVCRICGHRGRDFLPMGTRQAVRCPRCHGLERHRALWHLLEREGQLRPGLRVLEIAPLNPRVFGDRFRRLGCQYVGVDRWPHGNPLDKRDTSWVQALSDVTALGFRDGAFDLVLMQHVIEEVPNDRAAFAELCRVLAPEGVAILEVPHAVDVARTTEFAEPGKYGNVRRYGVDWVERLPDGARDVRQCSVDGTTFTLIRTRTGDRRLCLPILLDHPAASPTTTAGRLRGAIDLLDRAGCHALTAAQVDVVMQGRVAVDRAFWLTFDDGQAADLSVANAVLQEQRVRATSFVIPGRMTDAHWAAWAASARGPMLEVQSHTWSHELGPVSGEIVDIWAGQSAYSNLFRRGEPYGTPVFAFAPALSERRFLPDAAVVADAIAWYGDRGEPEATPELVAELAEWLRARHAAFGRLESDVEMEARTTADIAKASDAVASRTGYVPIAVAFPWGAASDVARRVAARHHRLAVGVAPQDVNEARRPHDLTRIDIRGHIFPAFREWLARTSPRGVLTMPRAPRVTVLMTTFNRRPLLGSAIASVVAQTFANWELLVVNDGGVPVVDLVEGFRDPRITLFSVSHRGKPAALNYAIQRARGHYVAYLDDDDEFLPNHLEVLTSAMDASGAQVAHTMAEEVVHERQGTTWVERSRRVRYARAGTLEQMLRNNYIPNLCLMHARALFDEVGPYDERLRVLIDWDMYRRLASVAPPEFVGCLTAEYRRFLDTEGRVADVHLTASATEAPTVYHTDRLRIMSKLEWLARLSPAAHACIVVHLTESNDGEFELLLAKARRLGGRGRADILLAVDRELTPQVLSYVRHADELGAYLAWNESGEDSAAWLAGMLPRLPWARIVVCDRLVPLASSFLVGNEPRIVNTLPSLAGHYPVMAAVEKHEDDDWVVRPVLGGGRPTRVLLFYTAPVDLVQLVAHILRDELPGVSIAVFGRPQTTLERLADEYVPYRAAGAYAASALGETAAVLRARRDDLVVVPLSREDDAAYGNIRDILGAVGIDEYLTITPTLAVERKRLTLAKAS